MADLSKLRFNGTDYNVKDASAPLRKFTNYSKTGNLPITSDDTTQTAIGKLEKALDGKINTSAKGTASGVAELDANGKVPSSQLPSYVDDVLEYSAKSSFPSTGETGKIYVDTSTNKTYRWSGSAYVEISESLALGETSSTAYRGDRGKAAYDHSQASGNPHGTTGAGVNLTGYSKGSSTAAVAATDTVNAAIAKHENRIDANKTNILYAINNGVKNLIVISELTSSYHGLTINRTSKGVTISGTADTDFSIALTGTILDSGGQDPKLYSIFSQLPNSVKLTGAPDSQQKNRIIVALYNDATWVYSFSSLYDMPIDLSSYTYNRWYAYIPVTNGTSYSGTWYPMLQDASISDDTFVPGALPNYDLTRLEAEDRASLAEVVDSGAKNVFNYRDKVVNTSLTSFTNNNDGTFTAKNNTQLSSTHISYITFYLEVGTYVLSGCPFNGSENSYLMDIRTISGDQLPDSVDLGAGSTPFTIQSSGNYRLTFRFASGYTIPSAGITFKPMICTKAAFGVSQKFVPYRPNWDLVSSVAPFYSVPINHNMIYRGQNLGATFTDAQHTALSSGNFTDLFLGDYWTKSVTIPAGTYTGGDGEEVTVAAQTVTLKAVIADFDTFYAGYASSAAGINTHHAGVIVTGFNNVVWNKTSSTAGGYVSSLIHKWLVGSVLPQIETWFGSAKVLSHQKLLTNAITGDAASGWAWGSQKISLLSECQLYGMEVWGGSKATNGAYEPGEAFKKLDVFNHINANLLFGNKNIWCRDIASAGWAAALSDGGLALDDVASAAWIAPVALILLS